MSFINNAIKPSTTSKKMESLKKRSLKMEPLEERQLLSVNIGTADDLDDLTATPLVATTTSNTDLVADLGESPQNTENTPQALAANDNTQTETPIALNAQTITVSSESELNTALANVATGDTIKLGADINLTAKITVAAGQDFTLDLAGFALARPADAKKEFNVITNNGTLTIKDSSEAQTGKITGGKASEGEGAGGINNNNGILTIDGGTITGNTGVDQGGICNSGTLTINGGTITGNTGMVGGISNGGGCMLTLNGGTITGNTGTMVGGIYNDGTLGGTLTVGGNVQVTDNTKTDGTTCNICFDSGKTIAISSTNPLSEGAKIGVTIWGADGNPTTGTFATGVTENDAQYFFADNADGQEVVYDSATNSLKLVNKYVVTDKTELTDAMGKVAAGDIIQLGADIDLTAKMIVTEDQDFTLDLNGCTLKQTDGDVDDVITLIPSSKLTIIDSSTDPSKIGTITGGSTSGINNSGTLTITGGKITGNRHGVYNGSGTLTVGGNAQITGNTSDNVVLFPGKTITISPDTPLTTGASIGVTIWDEDGKPTTGTFATNATENDAQYFTSDDSTNKVEYKAPAGEETSGTLALEHVPQTYVVTSEGDTTTPGTLKYALANVKAGDTIQLGANINLTAEMTVSTGMNFTLDLNGKTLASSDNVINNVGTLTIIDSNSDQTGTITGGSRGIFNKGALTLNGGKITGNAYGVYNDSGTLTITGGKITGNMRGVSNGGSGTLTVGGNAQITGNKSGNVYLYSGKKIAISPDNPLSEGARIGVLMTDGTGTFATNATESDAQYFFADNADGQGVAFDSDTSSLKLVNKYVVTDETELTDAMGKVAAGDIIQLGADINLTAMMTVAKEQDFTLDLAGFTLNGSEITDKTQASVIYNAGTLVITDSSSTDPEQQGKITGGTGRCSKGTYWGGGIDNRTTGILKIMGGKITGNSVGTDTNKGWGGGIYNDGTLFTSNCVIENNTASCQGGGINNNGVLNIGDGTVIQNNTSNEMSDYPGGGIYCWKKDTSTVSISGKVIIKDNITSINGQIQNANLCLSGSTNETVSLSDLKEGSDIGVTVMINDVVATGTFATGATENDAQYFTVDDSDGQAVVFDSASSSLKVVNVWTVTSDADDGTDGTLRQVLAKASDGDIIKFDSSLAGETITLTSELEITKEVTIDASSLENGITISGNQVKVEAGKNKVNVIGMTFTYVAPASGGTDTAFYVSTSTAVTITDCVFKGCDCEIAPIYLKYSTVSLSNCLIAGNTTSAGVYAVGSTVTMTNCTVAKNVRGSSSSGLFAASNSVSTFNVYNCIITNHTNDVELFNRSTANGYNTLSSFTEWSNKGTEGVVNYTYDSSKPLFAEGSYQLSGTDSQAYNLGNNDYWTATSTKDLDGYKRVMYTTIDMGAYEFQYAVNAYSGTYDAIAHTAVTIETLETGATPTYTYDGKDYTDCPEFTAAGDYSVTVTISREGYKDFVQDVTSTIDKRVLTVSGTTINDKVYDAKTDATIKTLGTLQNVVSGEEELVSVSVNSANFEDKNVDVDKDVTVVYELSGTGASNYTINKATITNAAEITPATVTISGTTANNKTYDAKTTATANLSSTGVTGLITGDDANVSITSATFADKNIGTDKNVTVNYQITGDDAGNYQIGDTNEVKANISPATLTVKDTTVAFKTYDGNNEAKVKAGTLQNVQTDDDGKLDDVAIDTTTGTFSDKNAAKNKDVTIVYTLTGTDKDNYVINPETQQQTIYQLELPVEGTTVLNKIYDGTTTATVNKIGVFGEDFVEGDDVTISVKTADFEDKYVGTDKAVFVDYTLTGADAGNYVASTTKTFADITMQWEVTTLEDTNDLSDDKYSLREIITIANDNATQSKLKEQMEAGTITFADSLFTEEAPTGTVTLTSALPYINYAYDIDGANRVTINGNGNGIIAITNGESSVGSADNNVVLSGLTLTGGNAKSVVGTSNAYATIKDCVITENTADATVYVYESTVSIVDSTLTGNKGNAIKANIADLTLVNNTIVGNTSDKFAPALDVVAVTCTVTAYNNLIAGNGTGTAEEQVSGATLTADNANLLSMATDKIFAEDLPDLTAGESWLDWNPSVKSTSDAAKAAVLNDKVVTAAFGVTADTDWDNVLDNYGNARTTVNTRTSERTMNIGSSEETVPSTLTITQDGNYVLFSLEYDAEEGSTYSLSYKLTTYKPAWAWAWKSVPMEVVTTEEGDTFIQCKVKKCLLGSCQGYDYVVTETFADNTSEKLVSGNLKVSQTVAPVYTVTSPDYNVVTLKFYNTNGNRLTEEQEALTTIDARAFVNCKWTDWSGEITLAELLADPQYHATRNEDGTYTLDFTSADQILPSGSTLQFKIYFDNNVVTNEMSTDLDDNGTLKLESIASWRTVALKQPRTLNSVVATIQGLTSTSVGVSLKYTDPSATGIQISTRQLVDGKWTDWTAGTTEAVQKEYTIGGLATANATTQVRLQAVAPSEPLALKPSAYTILTTCLKTKKLNTPVMYYNGTLDKVTSFTSINDSATVQGYEIYARVGCTGEFVKVPMLGSDSLYWTEEQIKASFGADDLTSALNLAIGQKYTVQIRLQAIGLGGDSLYTDSYPSLSCALVTGKTVC